MNEPTPPPVSMSLAQAMQLAAAHQTGGRLADAEHIYRSILNAQPGCAPALHGLGVLAVQGGHVLQGLPLLRQAIDADTGQSSYRLAFADALIRANCMALALDALDQARAAGHGGEAFDVLQARIQPGEGPDALELNTVIALFNQGQYAQLEAPARAVVRLYPGQGLVWKLWGTARVLQGQTLAAIEPLQQAARCLPQDADVRTNLGNALAAQGRLADAEPCLLSAIALSPQSAGALGSLGNLYRRMGRLAHAQRCYEQALQIEPGLVGAWQNLGVVLAAQGRIGAARANFEQAIALRPDLADAWINLASSLQDTGQLVQARELLQRGLAVVNGARWTLATLLMTGCWIEGDLQRAAQLVTAFRSEACSEAARLQDRPLHEYFLLIMHLLAEQQREPMDDAAPAATLQLEVLGESHGLALSNIGFPWAAQQARARCHLVKGVKMHHLAQPQDNQYKAALITCLDALPPGSRLLLAVGEIDCRPDEGIWLAVARGKGAVDAIVDATTGGYLAWLSDRVSRLDAAEVTLMGVPAPACALDGLADAPAYLAMVKLVNARLKAGAAQRGWRFLDLHAATSDALGKSHGRWHLDAYHLRPGFYAEAQNWLI